MGVSRLVPSTMTQINHRPKHKVSRVSPFKHFRRRVCAFLFGLVLASLYGMTAMFVQNHGLWYCISSTAVIAGLAAFGMGLSRDIRANVMLMLPTLCSKNGRNLLLFLAFTVVVQCPMSNIMRNFNVAAESVVCGAEQARNQTRELVERTATPLLPVLSKVKEITRNAYSLAGRVQNLIISLTESFQHIARSLRSVLHFLASMGDVCNAKLGAPYKRCHQLFDEAIEDCRAQLSIFDFLCYIVDAFKPLCNLAKVNVLFCIIPSYIGDHIKAMIADHTAEAFEELKRQFEFNVSASMHFDAQLNSSQSVQETSRRIMEEISEDLGLFQKVTGLLSYAGLLLLGIIYIQAAMYKNSYLKRDSFDNHYITEEFVCLDRRRVCEGRSRVLPLSQRETQTYIQPTSLLLTGRERRAAVVSSVSVLRHIAVGCNIMALDMLVFWVFDTVHHLAKGEIVAKAPVMISVEVNGSGYTADIFKDIMASFDTLQKGNVTILSKKCLVTPTEPDYAEYLIIGSLYGLALFTVVAGSYVKRLRRLICASYHPKREKERILELHQRIMSQRQSLLKFVAKSRADGPSGGLLKTLALILPGGSRIAGLLGAHDEACMACGDILEGKDDPNAHPCCTPQCTGLYCVRCFRALENICGVCMGPLTFQEDSQEEVDSSDEEQVTLWANALSSHQLSQNRDRRRLMRRRISVATGRRCSMTGTRRTGEQEQEQEGTAAGDHGNDALQHPTSSSCAASAHGPPAIASAHGPPAILDSDSGSSESETSYPYPESFTPNNTSSDNHLTNSATASMPSSRLSEDISTSQDIFLDSVLVTSMNASLSDYMSLDSVSISQ